MARVMADDDGRDDEPEAPVTVSPSDALELFGHLCDEEVPARYAVGGAVQEIAWKPC